MKFVATLLCLIVSACLSTADAATAAAQQTALAKSINAARATAMYNPACYKLYPTGVGAFYWEIGGANGPIVSGSVGYSSKYSGPITQSTVMQYDSFSKVVAAAAFVQYRGGYANLTAADYKTFHMLDGYISDAEDATHSTCPQGISIDVCQTQVNRNTILSFYVPSGGTVFTNIGTNGLQAGQPVTFNAVNSGNNFNNTNYYYIASANLTSTTFSICSNSTCTGPSDPLSSNANLTAQLYYTPCEGLGGCNANTASSPAYVVATTVSGFKQINTGSPHFLTVGQAVAVQSGPGSYTPYSNTCFTTGPACVYFVSPNGFSATTFELCLPTPPATFCNSNEIVCSAGDCGGAGTPLLITAGVPYGYYSNTDVGHFHYAGAHDQNEWSTAAGIMTTPCPLTSSTSSACGALTGGQTGTLTQFINYEINCKPVCANGADQVYYSQALLAGGGTGDGVGVRMVLRNILNGCSSGVCPNGGIYYWAALDTTNTVCTNPLGNYSNQIIGGVPGPVACPAFASPLSTNFQYSTGIWNETDPAGSHDGAFSGIGSSGVYGWISASKTLYGMVMANNGGGSGGVSANCGALIRTAFTSGTIVTVMPNVVGMNYQMALLTMQEAGFYLPQFAGNQTSSQISYAWTKSTLPPGTVVAQSITGGTAATAGSPVVLTLSQFPFGAVIDSPPDWAQTIPQ